MTENSSSHTASSLPAEKTRHFPNKLLQMWNGKANKRDIFEVKFCEWIDQWHHVGWDFIDQSPNTLSEVYRGVVKRPDVMLLLAPAFSMAVDVKGKPLHEIYRDFTLDEEEIHRELRWEQLHNIPVFFAFGVPENDYKTWYFLRLTGTFQLPIQANHADGTSFRKVLVSNCVAVSHDDSLWKLFKPRI